MAGTKEFKSVNSFLPALVLLVFSLSANSQNTRAIKVDNLYSCLKEYDIECPKTVLAIAIYETGWMECRHCTYEYNNLFGFRANRDYLRFNSIYDCLDYLKIWQTTYYDPWKARHPYGTYYEYMAHVKYARANMTTYIRTLKAIERLVAKEIKKMDATPAPDPETETGDK